MNSTQQDAPRFLNLNGRWVVASTLISWAFLVSGSFPTEDAARAAYAHKLAIATAAGLQVGQL